MRAPVCLLWDFGRAKHDERVASLRKYSGAKLQGYLAHKKTPRPRTLLWADAYDPTIVLRGGAFSFFLVLLSMTCLLLGCGRAMHDVFPTRVWEGYA